MSYEGIEVRFPDTNRLYNYLAPAQWGLRAGDLVFQKDMFSPHGTVVRTKSIIVGTRQGGGAIKVLDSYQRQPTVTLVVTDVDGRQHHIRVPESHSVRVERDA